LGTLTTDVSNNAVLSATSNLRFLASNVGINQTTPLYPLDVSGTGRFTGNLLTGSGTANAPSRSFVSDPSTGMHLIGTSQMAFDTSGVTQMVISNSNVGIGTTGPTATLDVAGQIRGRVVLSNWTGATGTVDFTQASGNSIYNYITSCNFGYLVLSNPGSGYVGSYSVIKNNTTTGLTIAVSYPGGATGPTTPLYMYSSNAVTLIWGGPTAGYVQF